LNIVGSYSSFHGKMGVLAAENPLWVYENKYDNTLPYVKRPCPSDAQRAVEHCVNFMLS
jgi:hypothetical protein